MYMDIKENVVYEVQTGWKLWYSETATFIAIQNDGSSFEIFYPVSEPAGAASLVEADTTLPEPAGAASLVAAAATLLALYSF